MILPGHIAAGYLAGRATGAHMGGCMAACMAPDLVDKPVRWLLRLTPNDRIPAHSLLGCMVSTLGAYLWGGKRLARGWLVGYAAHLAADEINAHLNPGRIYFWWPFKRYTYHRGPTGLRSSLADFSPASLLLEAALAGLGLYVWLRDGAHRRQKRG